VVARWGLDTRKRCVQAPGVDTAEVSRQWQEVERELAVERCGAAAAEQPREALVALAEQLRQQEGGDYTTKLTGFDAIGQRVTVALARRYRLTVFRRKGQRRGTVMLMGPETFIEQAFWPLLERIQAVVWRQIDGWLQEALNASVCDHEPKAPKQLELG